MMSQLGLSNPATLDPSARNTTPLNRGYLLRLLPPVHQAPGTFGRIESSTGA